MYDFTVRVSKEFNLILQVRSMIKFRYNSCSVYLPIDLTPPCVITLVKPMLGQGKKARSYFESHKKLKSRKKVHSYF